MKILLIALLLIYAVPCYASVDSMREDGTLLVLFVAAVFGGFYIFGVILCLIGGNVSKEIEENKHKEDFPKKKVKVNPYNIESVRKDIKQRMPDYE